MEEVGGYEAGERDYTKLRGGTGPLVYPAGFVHLFHALQRLTAGHVASAQVRSSADLRLAWPCMQGAARAGPRLTRLRAPRCCGF